MTSHEKNKDFGWGGKREGAGRPKGPKKFVVQVSLTAIERNRYRRLGGSRWLKRKLKEEFSKR